MINQYWDDPFPKCPPVSWVLRETYPNLWFRIHSLPESKRYPENEEEFEEVLRRDNMLCSDLFAKNAKVYLLLTEASPSKKTIRPKYIDQSFTVSFVTSVSMREVDAEEFPRSWWHIWCHSFQWDSGYLDLFFRQAALWEITNMMVLDPQTHHLFCPYDGGSDIFLSSLSERDIFKLKYKNWLSSHPLGL